MVRTSCDEAPYIVNLQQSVSVPMLLEGVSLPGSHQLGTRHEKIFCARLLPHHALRQFQDSKDSAHTHSRIQIAAPIDGIACHHIPCVRVFVEVYDFFLFFRDEGSAAARALHRGNEEVIADDVELLLVVSGGVGGAGKAGQVDEGCAADVVGDRLEGKL